ncbi:hypothetical protein [Nocardia pneumoniae]|uniref:hypothetical protein n=1 Tax=Nocardia pneumoniae TaxID=228601 RepID=UPI0002DE0669|nr:hypothetical protein [Nocardia pneumoniae]
MATDKDEVVDEIKGHYEPGAVDDVGFQDGQAEASLEALSELAESDPAGFEEALGELDYTYIEEHSNRGYEWEVPADRSLIEQLVHDAEEKGLTDEYADLIEALETGDASAVVTEEEEAAEQEAEQQEDEFLGSDKDFKAGDDLAEFPLEIRVPPGSASDDLTAFIELTNFRLKYLMYQMGEGKKPIAFDDGKDDNPWDDDLGDDSGDNFYNNIEAGASGATEDAYQSATNFLHELAGEWSMWDEKFEEANTELTYDNYGTYQRMYDRIQEVHDAIWLVLQEPHAGSYGSSGYTYGENNFTAPGIQHLVEEAPIYGLVIQALEDCVKEVNDYAHRAEEHADRFGDFPGYPSDEEESREGDGEGSGDGDGDGEGEGEGSGEGDGEGSGDGDGSETTVYDDPFAQAGLANEDLSSTFEDLLPGATDTTDLLGSTESILGGDTSSSMDIGSLIQAAMQGTGTGSGTGMTTGNAATPTNNNGGADNNNSGADMIGPLMAMNALSQNQNNRPPTDDRGDEKDPRDEREHEQNRNAPANTANPAVQTSPPGVTAPTYAGTPPTITTPGAAVDVQIGESTVKAPQGPVAEALQKQAQNFAFDAKAAYAGTAGELTADHPPAIVDDLTKLQTGDYVEWERFSALIVKDQNGQLNILDHGRLVPFDPNNPPLVEKYGNFRGYFHPTGLDGAAGADRGSAAPPPATVSTAQPGGLPPVSPPQI